MHSQTNPVDDDVDLKELLLVLWEMRRFVILSSLVGLALAAVYAFAIAKPVYESSALLIPTQSVANSDMGAAAALLGGKKLASPDVDLYQSLLTSRAVIQKLLRAQVQNLSDTGAGRMEPLHSILGIDTSNPASVDNAVQRLGRSLTVDTKESGTGGIIEVRFKAPTPWLAQQIGSTLLDIGQEQLRLVRIERSNVVMSRLNVAVSQARSEWDSAARNAAWYKDRNRSLTLPDQLLELARLEMEKSAKEQRYLLARKEYELQMLDHAKAVPPMLVLDPANLPSRKSKPNRPLLLALGLALGAMGSCAGLLGWKAFGSAPSKTHAPE